jgi:hypothetical protein
MVSAEDSDDEDDDENEEWDKLKNKIHNDHSLG